MIKNFLRILCQFCAKQFWYVPTLDLMNLYVEMSKPLTVKGFEDSPRELLNRERSKLSRTFCEVSK